MCSERVWDDWLNEGINVLVSTCFDVGLVIGTVQVTNILSDCPLGASEESLTFLSVLIIGRAVEMQRQAVERSNFLVQ